MFNNKEESSYSIHCIFGFFTASAFPSKLKEMVGRNFLHWWWALVYMRTNNWTSEARYFGKSTDNYYLLLPAQLQHTKNKKLLISITWWRNYFTKSSLLLQKTWSKCCEKPEVFGGPAAAGSEKENPLSHGSNFTSLQWCWGLNVLQMHQYCSAG